MDARTVRALLVHAAAGLAGAVWLAGPGVAQPTAAADPGPSRADAAPAPGPEDDALYLAVDDVRRTAGLPPLVRDARLASAARVHADDMARHAYLGHVSPRNGDPATRAAAAGLAPEALAQNVMRADDAAAAHAALVASDVHRDHMLGARFSHVGIAAAVAGDGSVYLVQLFARLPEPPAAAPAQVGPAPATPPPPASYRSAPDARTPAGATGVATTGAATRASQAPEAPSATPSAPTPPPGARPAPPPPVASAAGGARVVPVRPPPPSWTPPETTPPATPEDPRTVTAVPTRHGYWLWWEGRWVWISRGAAPAAGHPRHRRPTVIRVR